MVPRTLLLLVLLALVSTAVLGDEPLSNDDVIALVRAGIGADVIIAKIATSPTSFVLTTDALLQLKKANVPDAVLKAMLDRASATTKESGTVQPAPASPPVTLPITLHDIGIPEYPFVCQGDLTIDATGVTFEITEPYRVGSICPLPTAPERERKWSIAWSQIAGLCYTFWDSGKTHGQRAAYTVSKRPELLFRSTDPATTTRAFGFGRKVTNYPGWAVLFGNPDELRAARETLHAFKPDLHGQCGDDFD
jgi:hypothetical protein